MELQQLRYEYAADSSDAADVEMLVEKKDYGLDRKNELSLIQSYVQLSSSLKFVSKKEELHNIKKGRREVKEEFERTKKEIIQTPNFMVKK